MRSDNDSGCGLSGPAQDWADEAWRIRSEAIAKGMEKVQSEEMNGTETPDQKEFGGYECWETNEIKEG